MKTSGHDAGIKSVLAFAQKQNGEVLYQIADGVFRVRMLVQAESVRFITIKKNDF